MFHGVMRGLPGKAFVGKAFGTTRSRALGDGGGESWARTGWLFRLDDSLASTEYFSGGDGGGVSRQTGAGAKDYAAVFAVIVGRQATVFLGS